ncbi:MAG: metallophosphoesterase family protein [Anaerolineaceae bacterium]|nr:metallophosphoesterase family protein [Anaerolineaceae bacterium]
MRTLILSDIHSNLTALQAVLENAAPFDRVFCLGDVVGYGPDPNECIETLRELPELACVKGNHDAAILGEIDIHAFNTEARLSLEWLVSQLSPENYRWLRERPEILEMGEFTLAHGSPRNPVWEYVMELSVARWNMAIFDTRYCLVGHTHIPCIFKKDGETVESTHLYLIGPDQPFQLNLKSIVNPGSVGQPRDRNPLSSYMIYDDAEELPWIYRRIPYDVEAVQERILAAGLPVRHAARLSEGW